MKNNNNRELWLNGFAEESIKLFANAKDMINFPKGIKLDLKDVRITCGFPPSYRKSTKATMQGRYSAMGVCYAKTKERPYKQIFILPDWCNNKDIVSLGATLLHELVHAIDNCKSGHGKNFRLMATAIGLEGKMTSTHAGAELTKWIKKTAKKLGKYPQGVWIHGKAKQTTRMLKIECPKVDGDCGAIARMSSSQIEDGTPICRCYDPNKGSEWDYRMEVA